MRPESHTAMGSITGLQAQLTLESSRRAFGREKDGGSVRPVMSIRVTTAQIARTAGGSSSGPTATSTAGNSARTCGRARERCDGPTRAPTRASGGADCPTAEVLLPERSQECSRPRAKNHAPASLRTTSSSASHAPVPTPSSPARRSC
jgi:hypothetical protein